VVAKVGRRASPAKSVVRKRTRMSTQARRAQLLRCAVEASADVGISRVGHVDVAERAHVSVPTVFAYFPTRQILVRAILKDVRRFYLELLKSVPREGKASDVAYALFWECTRRARTEPHYIRVWLDWSTAIRDEIWQRYLKLWNEAAAEFKSVLDRGQRAGEIDPNLDTRMAARILLGGAHTIGVMLFSGVDDAELEALVRHLVSGALHPPAAAARKR
jgi:TetR/AcrR family hemagglutinin/protease transcriptional regulator